MKVTTVGSGDAFGSGGRLQACFHVAVNDGAFLIDCGVTSLIGFNKLGLDPNCVSTIFISHLHGDHFGGLIWWVLHARHVAKRTSSLVVLGPEGIEERYKRASEALYPGSLDKKPEFELVFREYNETCSELISGVRVSVMPVCHPSGGRSYALRLEVGDKVISYSGDTEWVDGLVKISDGSDLFICECFGFEEQIQYHLNWATLVSKLPILISRRILLTHMGAQMLEHASQIKDPRVLIAEDGREIVV